MRVPSLPSRRQRHVRLPLLVWVLYTHQQGSQYLICENQNFFWKVVVTEQVVSSKGDEQEVRLGRPPHEPTEANRKQVEQCAAIGLPHDQIAVLIGISEKTLRKYYDHELTHGTALANRKISGVLFDMASKSGPRQQRAAEFWARMRLGWKDTTKLEHTGENGAPMKVVHMLPGDDRP